MDIVVKGTKMGMPMEDMKQDVRAKSTLWGGWMCIPHRFLGEWSHKVKRNNDGLWGSWRGRCRGDTINPSLEGEGRTRARGA